MTSISPLCMSSRAFARLLLSAWNKGDLRQVRGFLNQGVPRGTGMNANSEHAEMVRAAADSIAAWIDPGASAADEDLEAALHVLRHLAEYEPVLVERSLGCYGGFSRRSERRLKPPLQARAGGTTTADPEAN